MKAAVTTAPRGMELQDVPAPAPGPGEALVQVELAGICGSDLHFYEGQNPYSNYPQIQGHEFSGRVVAFGGPYEGPVKIGERVSVEPLIPCGQCFPCRRGRPNCCTRLKVIGIHVPGAFAEFVAVPVNTLHPAGALDPELTSLVEPISIGMQVVTRGAVTAEDMVAVFGAGMIGQAVLACAADRGARVLVVDKVASRLELARRLGAERTVDAGRDDPAKVIAEWTSGDGAAVVVDATGVPAVIRSAVDVVAFAGRIVIVGISLQEVSLPIPEFTRKELTILGSRNNAGVFGQALDLVRRHGERLRTLITHRYPLEQAPEAIEFALHHPAEAEKVLLTVGSSA
ncbi:MAG: zinc-binding alcohol dehydrogenase family protein [Chloroflexota bacterium]